MNRNYNIDFIKILACLQVVGLHTFNPNDLLNRFIFYFCGFSVPLFFMITGYFVCNKEYFGTNYCKSKILKILRLTFSWFILVYAAIGIFSIILHFPYKISLISFITFVWNNIIQIGPLGHFWYFVALLLVYLLLPVIYYITSKSKNKSSAIRNLWITMATISLSIEIITLCTKNFVVFSCPIFLRVWTWLNCFLLGAIIPDISKYINDKISTKTHATLTGIIVLCCIIYQCIIQTYIYPSLPEVYYDSVLSTVARILIFTFILKLCLGNKSISFIEFIAPLTLPIFIIHVIIIKIITYLNPQILTTNPFLSFVIALTTSSIVALGLHLFGGSRWLLRL